MNLKFVDLEDNLKENFELKGTWFLPQKPDSKMPGTLTCNANGEIALEIQGSFDSSIGPVGNYDYSVIHGETLSAEKITLFDCRQTSFSMYQKGNVEKYSSQEVYINAYYNKREDIEFDSFYLGFLNIDKWFGVSGFKIKSSQIKVNVKLRYRIPKPQRILKTPKYEIYLVTYSDTNPLIKHDFQHFQEKTYLYVEYKERVDRKDAFELINMLRNFFSFAMDNPTYPTLIHAFDKNNLQLKYGKQRPIAVRVYYKHSIIPNFVKDYDDFHTLFNFGDIENQISKILNNWLRLNGIIAPSIEEYLDTQFTPNTYYEKKFLNYVRALESFHRRMKKNYVMAPAKHRDRVNKIIKYNIGKSYTTWLKDKVSYDYINEPSQRRRFKELISEIRKYLEVKKDFGDGFISTVLNTRNYFTHYDEALKDKAIKGENLYFYNIKLKLLYILLFIKVLGISKRNVGNIFQRTIYRTDSNGFGKLIAKDNNISHV